MVEVRKPTPMTPERAMILYRRWRWAGVAALIPAMVLSFVSITYFTAPLLVIGVVCLLESRECGGWRDGYLARMRHERTEAGEIR